MNMTPIDMMRLSEAFQNLAEIICDNWDGADEPSPVIVTRAVIQLLDVLNKHDADKYGSADTSLNADEIDELGEYGLTLFQEMSAFAADLGLKDISQQMEDLCFPFTVWLARQNCEIKNITPMVNALARQANQIEDTNHLKQLFIYITEIIDSLSPGITQDLEKTDPMRPWRILIINSAIIATRSHDDSLMTQAFNTLVEHLPNDAARFFEEGVEQMHLIKYPDNVKKLMHQYYLQYGTPQTLH